MNAKLSRFRNISVLSGSFVALSALTFAAVAATLETSTGAQSCSSAVNFSSNSADWTCTDYACGTSSSETGCSSYSETYVTKSSGETRRLRLTGFGFSLPSDATVLGVTVGVNQVRDYAPGSPTFSSPYYRLRLQSQTANIGNQKQISGAMSGSFSNATVYSQVLGGGTADMWGTSLTYADVNDSTFGVAISRDYGASSDVTTYMQGVWMDIQYSVPTPSGKQAFHTVRSYSKHGEPIQSQG